MLSQLFPKATDRTPWGAALLSLVPMFIMGPVMVSLGYLPAWHSLVGMPALARMTGLLLALTFVGGLVIGAMKKFPRWSYPYTVFGVLSLNFIVVYLVTGKPWVINTQGYLLFLLAAGVFLLTWLVPYFHPYLSNLRRDWTQLSYGLFSVTLVLVTLHDTDVVPHFDLLVILPSLICLAGMLAYLRLAAATQRFAALILSMLLAVLLWSLPFFDGITMLGLEGGMVFVRFLLAAWVILLTLISAPLLIAVYNRLVQGDEVDLPSLKHP